MKNICLFSFVVVALAFAGCSKTNNGPSNTASVMFVNGCNGSSNIDTKIGGTKLTSASNIAYFNNSGYQTVTAGTGVSVNYYLTNQGTPLCNGTPTFAAGSHYSVFAGGIITAPTFVVTTDDVTAPAAGKAKVRFINLSSEALNESFYIGSSKLDSNISPGSYSGFSEVTATTGVQVLIQDPAQPTLLAQIASQPLLAGKIYTIMLSGTSTGTGSGVLTVTVINNN